MTSESAISTTGLGAQSKFSEALACRKALVADEVATAEPAVVDKGLAMARQATCKAMQLYVLRFSEAM